MEKAEWFRISMHMTAAIYLIYYLLPEQLVPGFYKWFGVILIASVALMIEGLRLITGKLLFGMKLYEKRCISAFAWFTIGMSIALIWFEMRYVVPVIIGFAFIDPLIGEIKQRKERLYPILPSMLYGSIMFSGLLLLSGMGIVILMLFMLIATFSAILAECWDIKFMDDNFLMIVVPLLSLSVLDYIFSWVPPVLPS